MTIGLLLDSSIGPVVYDRLTVDQWDDSDSLRENDGFQDVVW